MRSFDLTQINFIISRSRHPSSLPLGLTGVPYSIDSGRDPLLRKRYNSDRSMGGGPDGVDFMRPVASTTIGTKLCEKDMDRV